MKMRRTVLVIFLLNLMVVNAWSQGSLPSTLGTWTTIFTEVVDRWQDQTILKMQGDTIIGSQNYKRISESSTGVWWYYKGALREQDHVVYFVPADSIQEYLLYDYNLEEGDTVNSEYGVNNFSGQVQTVQFVDTILLEDGPHKWIYFGENEWVEGVGNAITFLSPINTGSLSCCFTYACMESEGEYSFTPFGNSTCDVGTENLIGHKNFFTIQPNPFQESTFIKFEGTENYNQFRIFNAMGMLIREGSIHDSRSFTLNREGLNDGVYLLELMNEKGQSVFQKLIAN